MRKHSKHLSMSYYFALIADARREILDNAFDEIFEICHNVVYRDSTSFDAIVKIYCEIFHISVSWSKFKWCVDHLKLNCRRIQWLNMFRMRLYLHNWNFAIINRSEIFDFILQLHKYKFNNNYFKYWNSMWLYMQTSLKWFEILMMNKWRCFKKYSQVSRTFP